MGNRQEAAERLRQTREAKKISLEEAQNKTKIHIGVLRALEKGETPHNVNSIYLKGFLKIYASFLGLEPKAIIEGFNLNLPPPEERKIKVKDEQPKKEFSFPLQKPQFMAALKLVIPLAVILLVILLAVTLVRHKRSRTVTPRHATVVLALTKEENIPIKKLSSQLKLAVRAKDNVWMHIKSDGKTVFQGIFRRGLSETWHAKDKIEFSLGDAAAVELEVNGERLKPLGRRGEAIKNVKITKEGISVGQPR